MTRRFLVAGGTGKSGSEVVNELRKRRASVRFPVRKEVLGNRVGVSRRTSLDCQAGTRPTGQKPEER